MPFFAEDDIKSTSFPVKRIAYISIFVALSAVGAMIKIPSPVGTIALDAAPGYFCALALGFSEGIVVIATGHLLTSGIVGFPLSLPLHLFIALQMALWALMYRWMNERFGLIPASVITILCNGILSACTLYFVGGIGAVFGTIPFLLAGSLTNVILAAVSYRIIARTKLI